MIRIFVRNKKAPKPFTITMNILNKYKNLSAFLVLGPLCFGQYQFEVKNASKNYDAIIQVENFIDCVRENCADQFELYSFLTTTVDMQRRE